jgi:hypothetical protein
MKKENKIEGNFAIAAALIVLFTTMLNPIVSAGISIFLLIGFVQYTNFIKSKI